MNRGDPKNPSAPPAPEPDKGQAKPSGRVQFDDRGQAVWEWQLKTGLYDRNASSDRIRALTELELEVDDKTKAKTPPNRGAGVNPYETVKPAKPEPKEKPGTNPYSQGPARRPENVSYNPDERPTKKP